MRIGELADRTGLSTKAIRYYEDIGILPEAARLDNGYRSYGTGAVDRIGFIKDAQTAGLSLVEIQVVLELRDEGEQTCHHTISLLENHLSEVQQQLSELKRTEERISKMINEATSLDPANCNDPNRCQTIAKQS